ncbi:MAG TPA: PSD1 and planctomycete cytochrome C domain-containing protein [Planctomicrobium sp.]|nr:PSD1 and planctomycete cytochrome C domain-containing protein [Planctomicrobium sp.]
MKWSLLIVLILFNAMVSHAAGPVSFSHEVLPLLSDRCFHCHGPDESHREADLRLDRLEDALADRGGYAALVPGDPQQSEFLKRILSEDPDLRMPPPDSHRKPFTRQEIEILKRWVSEGATWGKHWSFEKPVRPDVPDADVHPVDIFVQRRLKEKQLTLSEEASKETLIRRVSFDLTGLPPTSQEVEAFLTDSSPDAYDKVVDRLLQSPHYGERMAMWWLDAARYSDTDGFQADATRTNWPWRDWVVNAFNTNQPFDQFTVEQFAGDLLPDATPEQILATCFHRNHMTNGEGGRDPEESRIDYVIDRVNTTGTVWLGLTLGCAQCHSHKFDPISHTDYYSLFAFFNSIDEDGKAGTKATPHLKFKSPFATAAIAEAQAVVDQRKEVANALRKQAEKEFEAWLIAQVGEVQSGFQPWHVLHPHRLQSVEGTVLTEVEEGIIQASGPNPSRDDYHLFSTATDLPRITALKLDVFPHESNVDGKLSRRGDGEFILTDVKLQVRRQGHSQVRDIEIASAIADAESPAKSKDGGQVRETLDDDPRNGWTTRSHDPKKPHLAIFALAEPLQLEEDEELVFIMFQRSTRGDACIGRFRLSVTDQPGPAIRSLDPMPLEELAAAGVTNGNDVDSQLRARLLEQFLSDHIPFQRVRNDLDQATRQLKEFNKGAGDLNVMVLAERNEPRPTYILERGVWDKHGAEVTRAVPEAFLSRPAEQTQTRLDLAHWLVSRENPLPARVVVNQLWQLCFGAGLVRTPEDFGLQGELPTHPELLDWLAVELMDHDWDLKHVLRLIVTSQTYRQCSDVTPELLELDPDNRFLARGARFRLPSWMIRDAALRTSGLFNPRLGGPPVMPYQPEGVWEEMSMGKFRYEPSQGPAQFRRTLYAFWRRSSAPAFLFDSAQRRVCEVRPQLTNTPLQALTLLNDQTLLEASRELAKEVVKQETDAGSRLDFLFQSILFREPSPEERAVLMQAFQQVDQYYQSAKEDAQVLLDFGQPEKRCHDHPQQIAPWMVMASLIYNLDEAITHE